MLWTDMTNYSEVKSNKLCKLLDAALSLDPMNSKLSSDLGEETMLKLYNEAFYLSTRVVYEKDPEARPEAYMEKIQSDLGDKELVNYVIILMFYVLWQQSDKSDEVIRFTDKLQKKYLSHPSSRLLNWFNKFFKLGKNNVGFILKPSPYPADKLKDCSLNWNEITQGFSKLTITEILDLWESEDEKSKVIKLIEHARKSLRSKNNDDDNATRVASHNTLEAEEEERFHQLFYEEEKKTLVLHRAGKKLDTNVLKNTLEKMLNEGDIPSGEREGYVWYAVWLFFKKNKLLKNDSQAAFHRLIKSWIPESDFGNDDKMRRYNSEYLENNNWQIWKYNEFKITAKTKTSEKGFNAIKKLYEELDYSINITDLWKREL